MRINDDPWEVLPLRTTSFLNLRWNRDLTDSIYGGYNIDDSNVMAEDYIRMYLISMNNVGLAYERRILTVNEVVGNLGGLAGSIVGILAFIDSFFGGPFRELDRDTSFRHLQRACDREGQIFSKNTRANSERFFNRMHCSFFFQYWCYKTFPCLYEAWCCCFFCCRKESTVMLDFERRDDDPTFEEAIDFYDRLNNNFVFHMSLKRECLEHLRWVESEAKDKERDRMLKGGGDK